MIEITDHRCFVLWIENLKGKVSHEPTVYTSAAACISQGEKLKDKGIIKDYNFSVVMCPQINGESVRPHMPRKDLTKPDLLGTIQL